MTPVPLDPQARALLDTIASAGFAAPWTVGPVQARLDYVRSRAPFRAPPDAVAQVEDLAMNGPAGPIALRHYRGAGCAADGTLPGLVYFHGGGWVVGDLETHDAVCRALANALRGVVVAVDYRLAPEHKFPAAFDDALAATAWVAANAERFGIDPRRLVVGGDSAGGNLAAAVAIAARDAGGPAIAMQALVYPALDQSFSAPSHARLGAGYLLTREAMLWYRDSYLRDAADIADWRASPLAARDLRNVAAAYVITAGYDPLRDEGLEFARRLAAAEVGVVHECFEGMIHGFITMGGRLAAAHHAVQRLAQSVRQGLGLARPPGIRASSTGRVSDGD